MLALISDRSVQLANRRATAAIDIATGIATRIVLEIGMRYPRRIALSVPEVRAKSERSHGARSIPVICKNRCTDWVVCMVAKLVHTFSSDTSSGNDGAPPKALQT